MWKMFFFFLSDLHNVYFFLFHIQRRPSVTLPYCITAYLYPASFFMICVMTFTNTAKQQVYHFSMLHYCPLQAEVHDYYNNIPEKQIVTGRDPLLIIKHEDTEVTRCTSKLVTSPTKELFK